MNDIKQSDDGNIREINLSVVRHCLQMGDAKQALQYCHELLACDPKHVQTLLFAALASRNLGWLDVSLNFINYSLTVAQAQPAIYGLMGDILLLQKKPEQALDALLRAIELGDDSAQTRFNIGSAYLELASFGEAKIYFNQALTIDPQMVAANVNKGLAEHSLMNLDAALHCFDAALCIDPGSIDARWNKSHVLLTLGRYEEGFQLYETRWQHPQIRLKKRRFDSRLWSGQEHLSGKTILLYAEGGFGDTIQFIRYAKLFDPDVNLIIQCQMSLMELISLMGISAQIIAPGDEPLSHDFHCPLMSLPLAFGTTIDTVPHFDQYIYAPYDHLGKWDAFLSSITGPKIGIVARGSSTFSNDENRSFDLKSLASQLLKHATYIVLQKDLSDDERAFIDSCDNIIAPGEALENFSDTAAICAHLDWVISVDTSVAHLAGALGRPTIVLLAYRPDWRWGADSVTTAWYPSARLIRQTQPGSWGDSMGTWHVDCLKNVT